MWRRCSELSAARAYLLLGLGRRGREVLRRQTHKAIGAVAVVGGRGRLMLLRLLLALSEDVATGSPSTAF